MKIRTRFAPSPTGWAHLGTIRTAIYNYLFAKANYGTFILRIDDTDYQRNNDNYLQDIIKCLRWLNLDYDEIYYQSQRHKIYAEYLTKIDNRRLYYCDCVTYDNPKTVKQGNQVNCNCYDKNLIKGCLKMRVTELGTDISWTDQVFGKLSVNTNTIKDITLARQDGSFTYNFCNTVDDISLNISHIIRGCDHIDNTARQIIIWNQSTSKVTPIYAHLSMLVDEHKKKLSKRHLSMKFNQFIDQGYLPEAMINGLVRLGWSYGDQEIFTVDWLKKNFNLTNIKLSPCCLNLSKLAWINHKHLELSPNLSEQLNYWRNYNQLDSIEIPNDILKPYLKLAKNLAELNQIIMVFDPKYHPNNSATKISLEILTEFDKLSWDKLSLQNYVMGLTNDLRQLIRLKLTNQKHGPKLVDICLFLGKHNTLLRLKS